MIAALSVLIGTLALIASSVSLRTIHAWWTDPTRRWYRHLWFVEHHLCRPPVPWAATGSTAPSVEPTPAPPAQAGAGPYVRVTAGRLTYRVPSVTLTGDSSAADCVEPPPPAPGPVLTTPGAGPTPPASTAVAGDSQPPVAPVTVPRAGREGIPAGSSFLLPGVPLPAGPTTPAPGRARGVPRPGVGHQRPAAASPPEPVAAGLQPGAVPGVGAPVVGAGAPGQVA